MKTVRHIARVLASQLKLPLSALMLFMAVQEPAIGQHLSIADALVNELDGTASLTVSLSEPAGSDVSISWETINGSAAAGTDFTGGTGTLNIPAGTTEATIQVTITNDDLPETDEEFEVRLSNPVNATLADNSATVTIRWNDVIVANWDEGATNFGTVVYTHPTTGADSPVFRITTRESTVGAWRTMLHLTAGEADLYLSRGTIPTTGSHHYKSERTGADGLVLASDEFAPGEVWYLRVEAQAGAAWSMVTGEVFVQNLGDLGYSDSNSDGTYDIGEPVIPLDSGTMAIGDECMRFFRISVPSGTPAWSIWLNGETREVAVRKNQVPLHNSTSRHDLKQSGHMLVVPTYFGSDQTTFFLSVTGNPGDTVRLDSRIQEVVDIAHNSTRPPETVTGVPYRVFRLQMPVDQLAWEVTVTPLTGNPNVALRRGDVPSEFVNDAFSEAPGNVKDSATVVPPTLVDGTWFITVYGTTPYEYSLNNGVPVITPMDYVDTVVNDLTDKSGWRYYSVTDIASQLGSLGWELLLSAQVPGTEIAIRRNAVPGRWNYRTMGDGPSFSTQSMGHVDASSAIGCLQHPAHQADVWYVGIYTPDTALGPFELTAREITATTIAYGSSNTAVTDQPEGIWKFFRVDVPAGALGLDVWAKNVTSGDPQVVVRRDQLPHAVATLPNNWGEWVTYAASWPSGNSWTTYNDWSGYRVDPGGTTAGHRRLVAAMGRPMEPGTYYIGVYNNAGSGAGAYTLASRGIGADGSGCALEAESLVFAGGSAAISGLEARDGRFFKVSVPPNTRSWQVKVSQTEGELLLLACKDTVPDIRWSESADVINPSGVGSIGMSKSGDEIYHLLPKDGAEYLEAGDYYLAVVSQGVNPVNPGNVGYNDPIGTGTSSGTIQSVGGIPVTDLGDATGTAIVHPDTLAAGEIKLYQIQVPANTSVLEVVTDNRVGNPRVSVVAGLAAPQPSDRSYAPNSDSYGWDYGRTTGRSLNPEYATGNNPDVVTIPSPPAGFYTIAVRANPIDNSDYEPDPASYDLKVRAKNIIPLNFDAALNSGGGSHTVTSQLFKQQTDYYSVTVPPGLPGQDITAWILTFNHPLGDTRFQVSKSFTDWSQAISITGNTGVIAPPFLEPGTTCYVAVIGEQTAEYTITSSNLSTVVPPWPIPLAGNIEFGDSGAGLPGDQGRDLAVGNWDFYAVDIPDGNRGLLRTVLEAINGDPDLYIREDGVPTLDHNSNGTNGTLLYHRSMTETTTQYGNWVPWSGRTEHQLRPGRWYLGVKADGASNARYRLRVSTGSVVDLALDGASVTDQTLVGGDWRFYRFTIPEEAPLQWSVSFAQEQGDVVMHIRDTVPPGAMALAHESSEQSHLNAADDNKNQGPYVPEGFDLTGTHGFTVPWLRPGHTYYLGFHARNDATFSLTTTTAGSIGTIPSLDFYTGGIDATIPTGESLIYRIPVPPEATRIKWASTHPETVQLRMEQGTLPETTGPSQHYLSSGADSTLNQALASSSWPWIPGKTYYLRIVNNGSGEATVNLTMNGKNARTEDEDGNGLGDYWEQYWFGSTGWGARDDADGDSLSNFIEQAFNLDPTRGDLRTLAPGSGTSGLPLITVTGNGTTAHLRVEYIRRRNAGLTYTVQFASGLSPVDWQPAAAAETVTPIDDDWERVVVEDSESVATMPLRFGRVVVTRQ